jgi:hypothetical protein
MILYRLGEINNMTVMCKQNNLLSLACALVIVHITQHEPAILSNPLGYAILNDLDRLMLFLESL